MSDEQILHALRLLSYEARVHFHQLSAQIGTIMATLPEVQAAVAGVSDAVAKLGADVTTAIADIQALQGQPGGISPADLDPVVASLNAIQTSLSSAATGLEAVLPQPKP